MNSIDKYLPSQEKINYLIKFLSSFASTFIERYGKLELENLYSYQAPIYFEEYEVLKTKTFIPSYLNIKDGIQRLEKIKSFLPKHLSLQMEKTDKENINHYCFLKMNESLFLIEFNPILNIKILLPFYTEKRDLIEHQEDFNLLLENLSKDF